IFDKQDRVKEDVTVGPASCHSQYVQAGWEMRPAPWLEILGQKLPAARGQQQQEQAFQNPICQLITGQDDKISGFANGVNDQEHKCLLQGQKNHFISKLSMRWGY
ncbi:MAG: hypothetical protein GQ537_01425, partial [Gammaproteobacteria bacterium]|nr:hypothetical protein [Gammaproteobacteria bacterium]